MCSTVGLSEHQKMEEKKGGGLENAWCHNAYVNDDVTPNEFSWASKRQKHIFWRLYEVP